jgi:hypothetical protein
MTEVRALFLTPLRTEEVGRWDRLVLTDLSLQDDILGRIDVPAGYVTDFASIRFLHNVFLFVLYALVAGYGNAAATVHDWLYDHGSCTRAQADALIYRALRASGIARWRAWLFWAGVRIGAWRAFARARQASAAQ